MSEEPTAPAAGKDAEPPATGAQVATPPEGDQSTPSSIPYSRFKEVLDAKKTLEAEVAKIKDAQEKARKKELEEQGKFKELLDEQTKQLEVLKAKADQYDNYVTQRKSALLEKLPEDKREKFQNASLDLLEETIELLTSTKSHSTNAGSPGLFGGYKSLTEATLAYQKKEITDEQFQKIRSEFVRKAMAGYNAG